MSRNTKYAEGEDIMIDELLIKDPKFKKGFDAGFSRKQVVNDDWDEDLHPRDEAGKFTSAGGGSGSGASLSTGVPVNVLARLRKLQGEYDKGAKAEKEIMEAGRKHAESQAWEDFVSGKNVYTPPREKVEQIRRKRAIDVFKRAVTETGKIPSYNLNDIYANYGDEPAGRWLINKIGLEKDYKDWKSRKGRWANATKYGGYGAGSLPSMVHDEFDEDLHPRDEEGKFTFAGGGSPSGGREKGERTVGAAVGENRQGKKQYPMGEVPPENFAKVSGHIANATENAKMYAKRMAKDPNELTRHNMENSLIEAKEYENVVHDLGYKPGEQKDEYKSNEWDRDHAYEKLKQLADLAKEFDTIGHKISAGSNMEIYNKARESIRAHMSARLRAIQDLGLNNDYKDWKEACGYGDITGWDDVDWNDLS